MIIDDKDNPYINKNNTFEDSKKRVKRKTFRELIKTKYFLKEGRLYYKYERNKDKIVEKKIPYIIEVPFIFYSAHVNKYTHFSMTKSKENLKNGDFYYEGICKDLIDYILKCPKCSTERKLIKVKAPMKVIIEEGPHYRLQMDLWYLTEDISAACGFKYILDIIDIFSKWMFSYPLKNKRSEEILICLRKYILCFGTCKKLQTDNGLEFKNILIDNFCIENNIERIYSPPYHPQANGAVESAHKIIQKYINDYFYTYKEDFSIEMAILDGIEFHNSNEHSSTLYTPLELKDIEDKSVIEAVKDNIKKSVGKKIFKNNQNLLINGDKLLVYNNIYVNKKNEILKERNKRKGLFTIPAIFNKYTKSNNLEITIAKKFKDILENNSVYFISCDLVRLVNDDSFNYYLEYD